MTSSQNNLKNDFEVKNETTLEQELEIYFKIIIQDVDMNPSKESFSSMFSTISFPAEHPVSTPYFIPASLQNSARPYSIMWKIGVPVTALALVLGATLYSTSLRPVQSPVARSTNEFSTWISESKEFSEGSFNDMTSEEDTLATAYTGVINNYSINENDF